MHSAKANAGSRLEKQDKPGERRARNERADILAASANGAASRFSRRRIVGLVANHQIRGVFFNKS
jgi:hypothetical protein